MKKIFAIFAALIITSAALFAGDFYNGDIQFHGGLAAGKITLNSSSDASLSRDIDYESLQFNLGAESWHLFRPTTIFGAGFMAGLNAGVGGTKSDLDLFGQESNAPCWSFAGNFEVGPAIGLYLIELIRIGFHFGYNVGFNYDTPYSYKSSDGDARLSLSAWSSYVGFSTGIQVKLFPESGFTPLAGWKLIKGVSDSYIIELSSSEEMFDAGSDTVMAPYEFLQNIFYVGFSINW